MTVNTRPRHVRTAAPDASEPPKWRVYRSGASTGQYGRGWIAQRGSGLTATGAWLPSWSAALMVALTATARERAAAHATAELLIGTEPSA